MRCAREVGGSSSGGGTDTIWRNACYGYTAVSKKKKQFPHHYSSWDTRVLLPPSLLQISHKDPLSLLPPLYPPFLAIHSKLRSCAPSATTALLLYHHNEIDEASHLGFFLLAAWYRSPVTEMLFARRLSLFLPFSFSLFALTLVLLLLAPEPPAPPLLSLPPPPFSLPSSLHHPPPPLSPAKADAGEQNVGKVTLVFLPQPMPSAA